MLRRIFITESLVLQNAVFQRVIPMSDLSKRHGRSEMIFFFPIYPTRGSHDEFGDLEVVEDPGQSNIGIFRVVLNDFCSL